MTTVFGGGPGCFGLGAPCGAPENQGFECVVCIVLESKESFCGCPSPSLKPLEALGQ